MQNDQAGSGGAGGTLTLPHLGGNDIHNGNQSSGVTSHIPSPTPTPPTPALIDHHHQQQQHHQQQPPVALFTELLQQPPSTGFKTDTTNVMAPPSSFVSVQRLQFPTIDTSQQQHNPAHMNINQYVQQQQHQNHQQQQQQMNPAGLAMGHVYGDTQQHHQLNLQHHHQQQQQFQQHHQQRQIQMPQQQQPQQQQQQQQQHVQPHHHHHHHHHQQSIIVPEPELQPIYVNAKQYHRIEKRREERRRAHEAREARRAATPKSGDEGSTSSSRGATYLHESRHRHAMTRPRGPGGRFLSAAERAEWDRRQKEEAEAALLGILPTGGAVLGAGAPQQQDKSASPQPPVVTKIETTATITAAAAATTTTTTASPATTSPIPGAVDVAEEMLPVKVEGVPEKGDETGKEEFTALLLNPTTSPTSTTTAPLTEP